MPAPAPESNVKRAAFKREQTDAFRAAITANKQEKKSLRKAAIAKARDYQRAYRANAAKLITQRRQAKSQGNFFLEAKPKVAIVVRIRGIAKVPPKPRKVMQLLRIRSIFSATFVKLNKPMQNMLRICEPWITTGAPSLKTVRSMVYKRGFLRVNNNRVKIADNKQIKDKFGSATNGDVICAEDIVNQIYTCGKHFQKVTNGMWHYKLSPPKGGLGQKRRHFVEGGARGWRDTLINKLIYRMA
jgi:large subunit ribosomal protein L7e